MFISIIQLFSISCAKAENLISPIINKQYFEGFSLGNIIYSVKLSGYEYKTRENKNKKFNFCSDVVNYDYANIAPYEQMNFKLLKVSCVAINKYKNVKESKQSFFHLKLNKQDYKNFPALSAPFLSKTEYNRRKNKTIAQAYKLLKVTLKKNTVTLLTKNDEIYITVLARGDFNNDGIEDLLVSSEWYARDAYGKHADLVILSKTGQHKAINIDWRLNKVN